MKHTRRKYQSYNVNEYDFKSLSEFYNFITTTPFNKHYTYKRNQSSNDTGSYWAGTNDFDEAVNLFKNGWSATASKIASGLKKLTITPTKTQRMKYDVAGFQASVPRYLQGNPMAMINKKTIEKPKPIISVVKNISFGGNVSAQQIEEESIQFIHKVRQLEADGYAVNVYISRYGSSYNNILGFKVKVKSSNEKLNISKLAFPLAHPSMLRRLGFRFTEVCPHTPSEFAGNYGSPLRAQMLQDVLGDKYTVDIDSVF